MPKKLRELKDLVQEAIDKGATTVEQVHKTIANMPLDVLEKIEPISPAVKEVRKVHDATIGNVYEIIRTINQKVGEIANDLLSKIEKE